MKSIISPTGTFGGFTQVNTLADSYDADGTIYPFNVIGSPNSIGTWVEPAPDLTQAKLDKNLQINSWRSLANKSTFTHLGKTIACDDLSRSDIDAVAGSVSLNGAFPTGFPGAWKATDNSYLLLPDLASFKAMYSSMTAQGTANFQHSQTLKTALAAATTLDQINAIVW
jgi:hypothetical protein